MAFPPSFLAELAARNPIEEVVGQYVNLRRSGSNLFGLCPFHGEKTASFSVAPESFSNRLALSRPAKIPNSKCSTEAYLSLNSRVKSPAF